MTPIAHPVAAALARALGRPPVMPPPARELRVERIGKAYGTTRALDGVDLAFRPGTVHTILGENGSGKSTLLKLLSGIIAPTEGRIVLNGQALPPGRPAEMQALGIGTVFQEVLVAPNLDVTANVLMGQDGILARRVPRGRRPAIARALLETLGANPVDPAARAGRLPLAARQLVVIARAFARMPAILLLDEATAALDLADREKVFAAIRAHADAGRVVIFISHRMEEVLRLSDRVSVLRSGRLVETLEGAAITAPRLLRLMSPGDRDAA